MKLPAIPHRATARAVINKIGPDSLIFTNNAFWAWKMNGHNKPKGIWELIDERGVKQVILSKVEEISSGVASSILDHVKTETFLDNFRFDKDNDRINCKNGEIAMIETNIKLEDHCRESYRTSQIPVIYDPKAECPIFLKFLHEIFRNDEDKGLKQLSIVEMMGYTLMSTAMHQKAIILVGDGANGKSVLLAVLEALCGKKNVSAVQPREFENTFKLAHLHGKLANIVTELEEGGKIAEGIFKTIIAGDTLNCSHKYSSEFEFNPYCTLWFSTNHLPHIKDFSDAVFRRAIVIQFNEKFEGEAADPYLIKKITQELPGILNVCLQAYQGVIARNGEFTEAPSSKQIKNQWRLGSDQVLQFVEEMCNIFEKGSAFYGEGFISAKEMYEKYIEWAKDSGIKTQFQLGRNQFLERMSKFVKYGRTSQKRGFFGVGFKVLDE